MTTKRALITLWGTFQLSLLNSTNLIYFFRMGSFMSNAMVSDEDKQLIIKYIDELKYSDKRDNALVELSR